MMTQYAENIASFLLFANVMMFIYLTALRAWYYDWIYFLYKWFIQYILYRNYIEKCVLSVDYENRDEKSLSNKNEE